MEHQIKPVNEILNRLETAKFVLSYVFNRRTSRREIVLQSKSIGRHRAEHSTVNIIDDAGLVLEQRPIDDQIANFIFNNFEKKGDTESFSIFQSDLENGSISDRSGVLLKVSPDTIRHRLTTEENTYTSTGAKLWYHKPIFDKYRDTGYGSIIRATLTNHQVCASRCQFCSTISRNKKDSASFEEVRQFVDKLYYGQAEFNREKFPKFNEAYRNATGSDIRLRGLILSGGGQPNLWPHFEKLVDYLSELDIDLGLITNGFPPKIAESIYNHFKWIRISITPEDASPFYPSGRFDKQYIPSTIIDNKDITVGYSYVVGPWTSDDILKRISKSIADNGFNYCRTLTDCNLSRESQLLAHQDLGERLYRLGLVSEQGVPTGKIFHQLKYHGTGLEAEEIWTSGQCYLQTYNVFWDTTGHEDNGYSYCYPCDSVTVLSEHGEDGTITTSERKFNATKWGTVKNTEVEKLFREPVRPYFDPRNVCRSCLFMKNNKMVKNIIDGRPRPDTGENDKVEHINFP